MSEANVLTPPAILTVHTPCISSEHRRINEPEPHAWAHLTCHACGGSFDIPIWCGDRTCVVCAKLRSRKYQKFLKDKLKGLLGSQKVVRFVTLTVKNTDTLAAGYDNLRRAFSRLRERDIWVDNVVGGCYSVEVTNDGCGWHVHLHCIYEGDYIPQNELSEAWYEVTNDKSYIVDIRAVKDFRGALRELSKYPFKPSDIERWTVRELEEYGSFMSNRHLFNCFGSWYGAGTMISDVSVCPFCGAEDSLYVSYSMTEAKYPIVFRAY